MLIAPLLYVCIHTHSLEKQSTLITPLTSLEHKKQELKFDPVEPNTSPNIKEYRNKGREDIFVSFSDLDR